MVVKRVGAMSLAKIQGTLCALFGLIAGVIVAAFALLGSALGAASSSRDMGIVGAAFGAGAVIALPIMYGVFGFVFGLIWAWLYNWVAGMVGGVELDVS